MNFFLTLHLVKDKYQLIPHNVDFPEGYAHFDLDNFSDDLVVATAIKAVQCARTIVVLIQARSEAPLGIVIKLLNALVKSPVELTVIFNGDHSQLEKMLPRLKAAKIIRNVDMENLHSVL